MRIRIVLTAAIIAITIAFFTRSAGADAPGRIAGRILDSQDGAGLAGVQVTISGPRVDVDVFTDASGRFVVGPLSPGVYSARVRSGEATIEVPKLVVRAGATTKLNRRIDAMKTTIVVKGKRGRIEVEQNRIVTKIDRESMERIPTPGTSYEGLMDQLPGSVDDGQGYGIGGASSLENRQIINGQDTTSLATAHVGTPLQQEFLDSVEIIGGGYLAEHGRATGGIVMAETRSGTNEFHGTIFSQFTNSLLQSRNAPAPLQNSIDIESNLAYDFALGGTLGGPIVKDRAWFFVGFIPRVIATDTDRITKRRTDCRVRLDSGELSACEANPDGQGFVHADGFADRDDRGRFIYEELDRKTLRSQATEYQFASKIDLRLTDTQHGYFSFSGTPFTRQDIGAFGELAAVSRDTQVLTTDVSAGWTSKSKDSRTVLDAQLGMHRSTLNSGSIDDRANTIPHERLVFGNFGEWAAGASRLGSGPRESAATTQGCRDSSDPNLDPYYLIENCPDEGIGYSVGGIGALRDEVEERLSAKLALTRNARALGAHALKAGIDIDSNQLSKIRRLSGDAFFTNQQGRLDTIEVFRYVALAPDNMQSEEFPDECGRGREEEESVACNVRPKGDIRSQTLNAAAFMQDRWQPIPELTINAGLRYEEQRLRNAEHLQDTVAVGTGERLGKNAMVLRNLWSPRLGVAYDWTKRGRSKLYGTWGRYYEAIPMDINDRSFGGESWMRSTYDASNPGECGADDPSIGGPSGAGCIASGVAPTHGDALTGAGILVASDIEGQYLDETIVGVDFELPHEATVGLRYQRRRMGSVLEDLSTDNANTYVLANPGYWPEAKERALLAQIEAESDPEERARLTANLENFRGIRAFDKPRRDYDALSATLTKRFAGSAAVRASYTYSATAGNYQGLFSSDNGQVDPNITSLFDLPELMANRSGRLPQDRPHNFKLDGYYTYALGKADGLSMGASLRIVSGTPVNVTGSHYTYGPDETMLLPRGSFGRVDADVNANVKLGYLRNLGNGMRLEGFIDIFNLNAFEFFGGQGVATLDGRYTASNVGPVVGGSFQDLVFLKEFDDNGRETGRPATRSRNFGAARTLRSAPSARLTARLRF